MVKTVFPCGAPLLSVLLLSCAGQGATKEVGNSGITFESKTELMYDTKPKFRLKGSGFNLLSSDDLLKFKFNPPLVQGDVVAKSSVKSDDVITFELASGKRWTNAGEVAAQQPLVLEEAFLQDVQLLEDPITVATLLPTPTVHPSTNIVYLTTSPHLKINGTNFNEKSTALYFNPPLREGTDVSVFVKSPTTIWVTLVSKEGKRWAEEPGPLKLVSVDTGAGPMMLRTDLGGVMIAEMQADMEGHGISVETHEEINLYQSTKSLAIAGKGFRAGGTKFRFGHALAEGNNYTVETTESSAVFSLVEGSRWRQNSAGLPAPLLLLAADGGDGYVPLGATTAKSGRRVATVFEDPRLDSSEQEISRTRTHELTIEGTGFTKVFPPLIVFDPHIDREDYVVKVMNRTHLKVSLAGESNGWMAEGSTGTLSVQVVNTGAGMFQFEEPISVAMVVADDDPHHSGINISPNYITQIYQSSGVPLVISGEGFPLDVEPKLTFGFGGPSEEGFTCKVVSERWMELAVVDGHTWAKLGGPLMLTKAVFGEHEVTFRSPGLKVATILDDPFVEASQLHVYATHTRHITIQGHGFLSSHDIYFKPQVVLSPTMWGDYTINDGDWTDVAMTISLVPKSSSVGAGIESKWAEVMGEDSSVDIKVVSIDTGAGGVFMPGGGIVVAEVRMDDATFSCDDSCIYANDGQCDEDQNGEDELMWPGYVPGSNAATSSSQASGSRGYVGYSTTMDATDDLVLTGIPSCPIGTDCTDCGLQMVDQGKCVNSCKFARDGMCDDRRASGVCPDGTDCQDCGPWGQSNYTTEEHGLLSQLSIVAYDDDDSGFLASDLAHPMFNGQINNGVGRYKRVFAEHKITRKESEGAEGVFMETLWAAIVLVGFSVTAYITVLAVRCAKGQAVSLPIPTNPDAKREGPR